MKRLLKWAHGAQITNILCLQSHNKTWYVIAIILLVELTAFKFLHPNVSYIHGDSFSYLYAAFHNLSISTYPIGYSRFLRLISVFNKSDIALSIVQFTMIQASALYFLYTLFTIVRLRYITQYVLIALSVFNPLFMYLGNLVSSDGLFLSLSILWFTTLLRIINRPSKLDIAVHTIVLFLAFITRYNALYYPLISAAVLGLSKFSTRLKLVGIASAAIVCLAFMLQTMLKYKALTGYAQYSPFSGWQLANNAMYAYKYITRKERQRVPAKFRKLDSMVVSYFDSTRDTEKFPEEAAMASTYYMWSKGMPLMKYRDSLFARDENASELKRWASMGPLYKSYGIYLIETYPISYLRHFIWPNANKYYSPPVEFLEYYNSNKDTIPLIARAWFGYEDNRLMLRLKDKRVYLLDIFPYLSGVINILLIGCLAYYIILRGWKFERRFHSFVLLATTIWICNAMFTISASSAALRFQTFPITVNLTFVIILIDWLTERLSIRNLHMSEGESATEILQSSM